MASLAANDADENLEDGEIREQDRFLPIANISRIMKKSLPPNAKIAKDAKETVQVSFEIIVQSLGNFLSCFMRANRFANQLVFSLSLPIFL